MSEPNHPKERRLHPRFSVEGSIHLGKEGAAVLKDLSMSGLSCLSPVPFEEMTVLEVTMKLPGDQPVTVGGAVVRCEASDEGHLVAIFFTHMDETNTVALRNFIEGQQRS